MKTTKKMQNAISKLEEKYGKLEKKFFVEDGSQYCELTCSILKSLYFIVNKNGQVQTI